MCFGWPVGSLAVLGATVAVALPSSGNEVSVQVSREIVPSRGGGAQRRSLSPTCMPVVPQPGAGTPSSVPHRWHCMQHLRHQRHRRHRHCSGLELRRARGASVAVQRPLVLLTRSDGSAARRRGDRAACSGLGFHACHGSRGHLPFWFGLIYKRVTTHPPPARSSTTLRVRQCVRCALCDASALGLAKAQS